MDAHGINVFDETDRDHPVLLIPYDLHLQLLPPENRLLDQELTGHREAQAAAGDGNQLLPVIGEPSPGSTHGVGGADDDGKAELTGDSFGLVDGGGDPGAGGGDPQPRHGLLEELPVLSALDGLQVHPDDPHAVLLQDPRLMEGLGHVEPGLTAEVGKKGVRPLQGDDLLQPLPVEGFHVGGIRHGRIGHDGGGVGVDQDNGVTQLTKRFTRLGSGIIELTGLPDHDRTGPYDENLLDIVPAHVRTPQGLNGSSAEAQPVRQRPGTIGPSHRKPAQ